MQKEALVDKAKDLYLIESKKVKSFLFDLLRVLIFSIKILFL